VWEARSNELQSAGDGLMLGFLIAASVLVWGLWALINWAIGACKPKSKPELQIEHYIWIPQQPANTTAYVPPQEDDHTLLKLAAGLFLMDWFNR
jgi:hypothetical protein